MRHLRSDYDAIQPWPVKRAHNVKMFGELIIDADEAVVVDCAEDVAPLIADDEPVFLLRGQDPAAGFAVHAYAVSFIAHGGDPAVGARIKEWSKEMKAYSEQAGHGPPDVPPGVLR